MQKRFFRHRGHGVPVQGQKGQLVDPGEGLLRQRSNQVEAEIKNLGKISIIKLNTFLLTVRKLENKSLY